MNIKILEKSELSSVVFIRDYVQFVFEDEQNNARLSSITLPIVIVNGLKYKDTSDGWRNALCSLINKLVKTASVEEGKSIRITFEDGEILEISLNEKDYEGPEAAMLFEDNGKITVW